MSLERAAVNCQRCFKIASDRKESNSDKDLPLARIYDNDLWTARNEAMRALEHCIEHSTASEMSDLNNVLKACADCDYSSPKIDEYRKK